MKKWMLLFLVAVSASSVWAVNPPQVSRLTYFPVSYASYYRVNVANLAIGLGRGPGDTVIDLSGGTNGTSLQLASEGNGYTQLFENTMLTLKGTNARVVLQDPHASMERATIGATGDNGKFTFNNVRIHQIITGDPETLESKKKIKNLNIGTANIKALSLFGYDFPTCAGTMEWVHLKFVSDGVYSDCSWYLHCTDDGHGSLRGDSECDPSKDL